ncbi:DUF4230 domain-containing protein [Pseudarthrobacter phenanthrenivorans]|uniref:DUF4230 domain-containing protein n=1 Tax=Pseudarthrobacter phenanthrenivorans TaxID=361575 RepID=A0A3B0G1T5_PSEPS|nr:DUF4230 domain-containing protein [Pseudarthrobacter phenanthrenivorans]RKO26140.1 DUF4230 domain-containing protein [Pseudarthrobacter phenanthrenivorans]
MSEAKSFKPVALIASAVAVLMAALLVASMVGFGPFSNKSERSQTVLLKSVKEVSQLHSAIGTYELVVDTGDDDASMPDFIAGRRALFVAGGTVNAHVDLAGLAEEDLTLSADGKSVKVRLPEVQLDKPNIDHNKFRVYSQDRGVVDRIVDVFEAPQQVELLRLSETKIAAAAEDSELRARAAENAKATLTSLFGSLGYQVTFEDGTGG